MKEYICVAIWGWGIVFIRNATQEVAKNLKNWKFAATKRKILKNNEDWKNFLCSTIRNHVQWVYWVIKYEDYQEDSKNLLRSWLTEQSWQCLRSSSSFLSPRFPQSLAAILDCCEIHEKIWVFLETFLVDNMLDEILWILRWFKKFGDIIGDSENRRRERRTIAINTFFLFFDESKTQCLDGGKCPIPMTNLAVGTCTQGMTIPSYLSSEMHLKKFPDQ